jgi:hypothetical protein
LLLKFLKICIIWSRRQFRLGSIWRGIGKIRILNLGWFWLRVGFIVLLGIIRRRRSFHRCGNMNQQLLVLLLLKESRALVYFIFVSEWIALIWFFEYFGVFEIHFKTLSWC